MLLANLFLILGLLVTGPAHFLHLPINRYIVLAGIVIIGVSIGGIYPFVI